MQCSIGFLTKRCPENVQQVYRRTNTHAEKWFQICCIFRIPFPENTYRGLLPLLYFVKIALLCDNHHRTDWMITEKGRRCCKVGKPSIIKKEVKCYSLHGKCCCFHYNEGHTLKRGICCKIGSKNLSVQINQNFVE